MKKILFVWTIFGLGVVRLFGGGFPSLKLGVDARSGGLGMAYTALSDDASSGYWNPAGLVSLQNKDFILSHHRWIQGVRGEFMGFGWGSGMSGVGITILYTEISGIEHRIVPSPTPLGTFSAYELIAGFSYAKGINPRCDR